MIEIDEKTVDQAVDEILGGGTVREGEITSTGGAQTPKAAAGAEPSRRVYELICKDCGASFGSAGPAARYCPACRKKRTSPPENGRQIKPGNKTEPEGAEDVENGKDQAQKAWDDLATEANTEANTEASPAPDPADMEMDELLRTAADAMRRDTGDMLLALYETIREVAKASGRQPGGIIQTLYELDCILERAERRNEA